MATAAIDPSTLRELFTTPPAEFVAARNRLVKERRAAKDRDTATALAALRRPSLADWVLNVVASEHSDEARDFVAAAARVRDAQAAAIEGRDGPDVREALRELRARSSELLDLARAVLASAGRDPGGETGAVAARLVEVSGNEAASAQLAGGLLGSEGVAPDDPFAGLQPDPSSGRKVRKRPAPAEAPIDARALQQTLVEARRERDTLAKAARRAETAAEKATAAVQAAERRLAETQTELAAMEEQRRAAAQDLAEAEARLGVAQVAVDDAAR
jgi:hypothetical protein